MTLQTVLDLITAAARKLNAIQQGQTLNGSEGAACFLALNGLMDQLNSERENLFFIPEQQFPLTAGKFAYTIGPGGDLNVPRPIEIQAAAGTITLSNGAVLRNDLDLITENEWNAISDRSKTGNRLDATYYDHNYPVATIYVTPTPAAGVGFMGLSISTWSALPTFAALTDTINLPPAYWEMLLFALAVRIAPEFSAPVDIVAQLDLVAKSKMSGLNKQAIPAAVQQKSLAVRGLPESAPPQPTQPAPEV